MSTAEREGLREADPNEVTPDMLAAAWEVVRARYPHGRVLGPGPGFREAIAAALARRPPNDAAYDRETIRVVEGQREQYRTKMKAALTEAARLSAEVERLRAALTSLSDNDTLLLRAADLIDCGTSKHCEYFFHSNGRGPAECARETQEGRGCLADEAASLRILSGKLRALTALSVPSTDAPAAAQEGAE